jgi:hypothetical protein
VPLREFVLALALRDRAWVRMRSLWAYGLGLLAGMTVWADMSDAAIVELRSPGGGDFVRYVAGPGERNELTFAHIGSSLQAVVRVHDPGATVQAGSRCVSEDVHTAVCSGTSPSLYQFDVTLGTATTSCTRPGSIS